MAKKTTKKTKKTKIGFTPSTTTADLPKKTCAICGKTKLIRTGFYKSTSPLFSIDGCVPICTTCVKEYIVNPDGTINQRRLREMSQKLDKPLFLDDLDAAFREFADKHPNMNDKDIPENGIQILGIYFKNINSLKQNQNQTYASSERTNFIHEGNSVKKAEKARLLAKFGETLGEKQEKVVLKTNGQFKLTDDIISLFGEGYTPTQYRKMFDKYETLKMNYSLQTNLHQEALATYVRFKVKEEEATARGDVDSAKKWYDAAQNAAANGKLTPKQLSESDLNGGINSFSEIFKAVEQAVDVIPILPRFKFRPNDALDFNIWCYINYARELEGLPPCEYKDVYAFYDRKKKEYIEQYGDPYDIFADEPEQELREKVERFLTLPQDYNGGDI